MARSGIETGFLLDRQWRWMSGPAQELDDVDETKEPALLSLVATLDSAGVSYAVVGGLALQAHQAEPRTTLGIDVAIASRDGIPATALESAGFRRTGSFEWSENWQGPGGPVQFTDEPQLASAIARAIVVDVRGTSVRVLSRSDLLHAKLRAAADPARRRSKRLQDLADALALLESTPHLRDELTDDERAIVDAAP